MQTIGTYILKGKKIFREKDFIKWGKWFEKANRTVAKDDVKGVIVSTVFLSIDHSYSFGINKKPILFETMIFGGGHNEYQERYSTWEEAEEGHKRAVAIVRNEVI